MQQRLPTHIELFNYGTFGKTISGYVEICVPFPLFLTKISLTIVQHFTGLKQTQNQNNQNNQNQLQLPNLQIDSNIDNWLKLTSYISPIMTIDIEDNYDHDGKPKQFLKELQRGIHRFPFSFVLPQNHPPMLIFPHEQRIRFEYQVKATIFSKSVQFDSAYYPLPMLFHSVPQLSSPPVQVDTPFNGNSKLIMNIPKTSYFTGERIDITLSLMLTKNIVKCQLSLVGVYRAPGCIHRIDFNSTNVPLTMGPKRFLIDIIPAVPPSIITPFFRFEHFILVELFLQKDQRPLKVFVPMTIVTSQNDHLKMMYAQFCRILLPNRQYFGIHNRPPPPFPSTIVDGLQECYNDKQEKLWLNHLTKSVHSSKEDEHALEQIYPLYYNSLLPEGWIMGWNRNEKYFIDLKRKTTTWKDPRDESMIKPQHVLSNSKGVLNILPIVAEGLATSLRNVYEIYLMVFIDHQQVLKTELYKTSDPEFEQKTFAVELDGIRENVCIYIFAKGQPDQCIGTVDINLSLLPFPSIIEDWFYLSPTAFSNIVTSGRIKLRLAYLDKPMPLNEVQAMKIDHVMTSINVPFYPFTQQYVDEVRKQTMRMKFGAIKMLAANTERVMLCHDKLSDEEVQQYLNQLKEQQSQQMKQSASSTKSTHSKDKKKDKSKEKKKEKKEKKEKKSFFHKLLKKNDAEQVEVPLMENESFDFELDDNHYVKNNDLFNQQYDNIVNVTNNLFPQNQPNNQSDQINQQNQTNYHESESSNESNSSDESSSSSVSSSESSKEDQVSQKQQMNVQLFDIGGETTNNNNNSQQNTVQFNQTSLLDLNNDQIDPLKDLYPQSNK